MNNLSEKDKNILLQEIQVKYKKKRITTDVSITDPVYAASTCRKLFNLFDIQQNESSFAVFLNTKNEIIGWRLIGRGTARAATLDIQEIISVACACRAQGVIITHNHPSGNIKPSKSDKLITTKIKEALSLVDIMLLDHIIVSTRTNSKKDYYSFTENNNL